MKRDKAKLPAYLLKVLELGRELGPGVHHVHVFHDEWCAIWHGGVCSCRPEVKAEPVNSSHREHDRERSEPEGAH